MKVDNLKKKGDKLVFDNFVTSELLHISNKRFRKYVVHSIEKGINVEKLGELFEKSLEQLERKDKGQFYTPRELVDYIISFLDINQNSKILDPACGCGSFLLSVLEYFKQKNTKNGLENIFGVDINESAVKITRLSLAIKFGFSEKTLKQLENQIKIGNSIVSNKKIDNLGFEWENEFKDILSSGGFDFVVGNPPYVTLKKYKDFDPQESIYSLIIHGPVNAATLMIGRALELLKGGGILAFVLPRTILYVDSYSKLRKYLLENTKILHIFDLGQKFKDVRGEQVILIIKKEKPKTQSHRIKIRIFKFRDKKLSEQPTLEIPQEILNKFNKFLIFDKKEYYTILEKILEKDISLNEYVDGQIFRGLPIGGNSHFISRTKTSDSEEVIRGKCISKFRIKEILFINKKLLERFNKKKLSELKKPKIILQNIFSTESGVIAAYDEKGIITLDTVTNIITKNEKEAKYLLGLLNSKLINFYIIYGLFNKSRLTMHADRSYLGNIPIIKGSKKEIERIVNYVDDAMEKTNRDEIKAIMGEIDKTVYKIYGLTDKEIRLVEVALKNMLSKRSWW